MSTTIYTISPVQPWEDADLLEDGQSFLLVPDCTSNEHVRLIVEHCPGEYPLLRWNDGTQQFDPVGVGTLVKDVASLVTWFAEGGHYVLAAQAVNIHGLEWYNVSADLTLGMGNRRIMATKPGNSIQFLKLTGPRGLSTVVIHNARPETNAPVLVERNGVGLLFGGKAYPNDVRLDPGETLELVAADSGSYHIIALSSLTEDIKPPELPAAGTEGQALVKASGADYDVEWAFIDGVLPPGGNTGELLTKLSGTDFDAEWAFLIPPGGAAGQMLAKASGADFDLTWVTAEGGSGGIPEAPEDGTDYVRRNATWQAAAYFSGAWGDVTGKPTWASVAFSGDYTDLINIPATFPPTMQPFTWLSDTPASYAGSAGLAVAVKGDGTGLEFLPFPTAPDGGIPDAPSNGNDYLRRNGGWVIADYFSGNWADISGKPIFATVAFSGDYNDLTNKPSVGSGSVTSITEGVGINCTPNTITDAGTIALRAIHSGFDTDNVPNQVITGLDVDGYGRTQNVQVSNDFLQQGQVNLTVDIQRTINGVSFTGANSGGSFTFQDDLLPWTSGLAGAFVGEVTTTPPTSAAGKPDKYVWFVTE